MFDLQVTTTTEHNTMLKLETVHTFETRLRGELIRPDDEGYGEARQVWNGMIDKQPALIARCADEQDVIAAVNSARDNDLLVAVRGGGHNVAGLATCDGGLGIDLHALHW
jgi:FAD/FMN-containing dehydrogenase